MTIVRDAVGGVLIWTLLTTAYVVAQDNPVSLRDRRGDKTGYVPQLKLLTAPRVEWKFTPEANQRGQLPGLSDPAAAGGMLFIGDDFGTVRAFTAKLGVQVWSHEHGERVFYPPMSDGERVFFMSRKGLTVLEIDSGRQLWHRPIDMGGGKCLAVGDPSVVYCGGSDGWVYALDGNSGDEKWKFSLMDDAPPDPPGFDGEQARLSDTAARPTGIAADADTIYQTVFDQCRVVAIDRETGAKRWSFQTAGWVFGDPAVDDAQVYVGSQDKHLYCLDKRSGRLRWKLSTGSRIESGPAVTEERVYIPSCDGHVYCLDKKSGELLWKFATDGVNNQRSAIYSAPIVTKDTVYFAASDGNVYALDSTNGELRWKFMPSAASELFTSPATDGTRIFVKSRRKADKAGENSVFAIASSNDEE
jgi:outer membrane protein assembly factor BamB